MLAEKLYLRRGRENRAPAPKSFFILAWVSVLGMDEWVASDEFDEAVAYGDIYECGPLGASHV